MSNIYSVTCVIPSFFETSLDFKDQNPDEIIAHLIKTYLSDVLTKNKSLILNCEGIINDDLLDFITALEHKKKIKPSLALNIEACKFSNSIAKILEIDGIVETFLMPFSSPLLKKRALSILSESPDQIVIVCDIQWKSEHEFTVHIESYGNRDFKLNTKEAISISGCAAMASIGNNIPQLNEFHVSSMTPSTVNMKQPFNEINDSLSAKECIEQVVLSCLTQAKLDPTVLLKQDTAIVVCSKAGKVSEEIREKAPAWLGCRKEWLKGAFAIDCDIYEMSAACASVGFAINTAKQLIQSNYYNTILIVGVETNSYFEHEGLKALRALSQDGMAKPFDVNRNGIVLGHGGGAILLEKERSLGARNAKALARLTGVSSQVDLSSPADLSASAIHTLLSKLPTKNVNAVVAHATGTIKGDTAECEGVVSSLLSKETPITSIKGAIGHLLYASGFPSIFVAIEMMKTNQYPTMPTTQEIDPMIIKLGALISTQFKTVEGDITSVLINNFGFYGCYSALILEAPAS